MTNLTNRPMASAVLIALASGLTAVGCRIEATDRLAANGIAPVYNQQTGRLEQLISDRDGDGKQETRAYMDGGIIKYIEIDRNADGAPDRWEYYGSTTAANAGSADTRRLNLIDHAEEANGTDAHITRREFYGNGVIRRVVDDTDTNGHADKWEFYEDGVLVRVDLDLVGKGYPSQRLVYGPQGDVVRIETDSDGDGRFVSATPASGGGR